MKIPINFVECFHSDLVFSILILLDDPADLIRVSAVSRSWHHFFIANGLCKRLCLRKAPQISNIASVVKEHDGALMINAESRYPFSWYSLERDHTMYSSLLYALSRSMISPKNCIGCVIGASRRDNHPDESIVNTLLPSNGQNGPNAPGYILFKLKADICIVTEIDIRPFEVFWDPASPVYSAKSVRFRMGHPKSRKDLEVYVQCLPMQLPVDKYVWTYTSPEFPMKQKSCLQRFELPEPALCIGGFLQIELLGMAPNINDGLHYLCLSCIRILGHSLQPAFDLFMETSSELSLKYCPDAVKSVVEAFSDPVEELRCLRE